ncbi:MAG: adenylosuccinate lyase [Planctomycetota bacterium]|jgi:adenylosuccinate lyase
MTSKHDTYASPLAERNASPEMLAIWSARRKFQTWRRIWLAVAAAQHDLSKGRPHPLVTAEQLAELKAVVERGVTDEQLAAAERHERELRHDVMAHVHALGEAAPGAKGIIHLGMTSQDVVCNADLLLIASAMRLVKAKLARLVVSMGEFAVRTKGIPALGFTHYQPAQPTTVGRRAAGWAFDLDLCLEHMEAAVPAGLLRGLKGATGTQASFLALLGSAGEVDELERRFVDALALDTPARVLSHSNQTYARVIDTFVVSSLASCASVIHKIASDIRLLCNRKELDEPFESRQIGSSAMPYKRNPMRCERACGLARFVMNLPGNAFDTAATQWLERTLDDSSNRRLVLPEAFLALDGALDIMNNVAQGLVVHEASVRANLLAELPFMATENLLMECVTLGADRQEHHEIIRTHAQAAGMRVKQEGKPNDLIDRLRADKAFASKERGGTLRADPDWSDLLDPARYVGRSVEQVDRFVREVVEPRRAAYGAAIARLAENAPRV